MQVKDALHNSLGAVLVRARAVCCVVFLANSGAIGVKKTPCSPSRSASHNYQRVMQSILKKPGLSPEQPASTVCHALTRQQQP
jgi:hypothetical protein